MKASVMNAATAPIGRFPNIHGQDRLSVMYPPRVGPIVGPMTTPRPNIALARPSCSRGNVSTRMDWEVRQQSASAYSLNKAKENQFPNPSGSAAKKRADREDDD